MVLCWRGTFIDESPSTGDTVLNSRRRSSSLGSLRVKFKNESENEFEVEKSYVNALYKKCEDFFEEEASRNGGRLGAAKFKSTSAIPSTLPKNRRLNYVQFFSSHTVLGKDNAASKLGAAASVSTSASEVTAERRAYLFEDLDSDVGDATIADLGDVTVAEGSDVTIAENEQRDIEFTSSEVDYQSIDVACPIEDIPMPDALPCDLGLLRKTRVGTAVGMYNPFSSTSLPVRVDSMPNSQCIPAFKPPHRPQKVVIADLPTDIIAPFQGDVMRPAKVETSQRGHAKVSFDIGVQISQDGLSEGPIEPECPVNSGSIGHPELCMNPCVFFAGGHCFNVDCGFCHLPHVKRSMHLDKRNRTILKEMCYAELADMLLPILWQRANDQGFISLAVPLLSALTPDCRQRKAESRDVKSKRAALANSMASSSFIALAQALVSRPDAPFSAKDEFVKDAIHKLRYGFKEMTEQRVRSQGLRCREGYY
mmetsp:Transcript_116668/g.330006  ORF Transcript_116668/g.330006 Transcript_116668/m.330006 type:complete len:480 (-) Transcript_116668:182-1621(-)